MGIYRSLALGYEILQDFYRPKQALINAFYYVCYPSPLMCRHPQRRFTVQRYYKICNRASALRFFCLVDLHMCIFCCTFAENNYLLKNVLTDFL